MDFHIKRDTTRAQSGQSLSASARFGDRLVCPDSVGLTLSRYQSADGYRAAATGDVPSLLDNETGMHSCLATKLKLAGWHRRQEEASRGVENTGIGADKPGAR